MAATEPKTGATFTLHSRDCTPCDAARRVVDALSSRWDPLDNWADVDATDGPGTLRDELLSVAASVLHELPIPTRAEGAHG